MPSANNLVHISSAGSGKTTYIVNQALSQPDKQILITTYTIENVEQLKLLIVEQVGCIPKNIIIQSWFSFLLQEGVRPYQNQLSNKNRVNSIYFQLKSSKFHKKDNYFTASNDIYSNKVSEFVFECNLKCSGLIISRLEQIYDLVFIDELQDFAGYDLNVVELLFSSSLIVEALGDPRQATFSTNNSQKNKQFRKSAIYAWLQNMENSGKIKMQEKCDCYRCNQVICDFADELYPEFPKTNSLSNIKTGHDGIFLVPQNDIGSYIDTHQPLILRYNKKSNTFGYPAINIGVIKGKTFDRVLIIPTKPMLDYLSTMDVSKAGDKSRLYVAVTRARYSVAFVITDNSSISNVPRWNS